MSKNSSGQNTSSLLLTEKFMSLLLSYSKPFIRVDFKVSTDHMFSGSSDVVRLNSSTASQVFRINLQPSSGVCAVDKLNGTALSTYFTIRCFNWTDQDGTLIRYEFFCKTLTTLT